MVKERPVKRIQINSFTVLRVNMHIKAWKDKEKHSLWGFNNHTKYLTHFNNAPVGL